MYRFCVIFCLLTVAWAGCAATEKDPGTAVTSVRSEAPEADNSKQEKSEDDATHLERADASPLSGAELETWNDPAFKKQYTESYIAETDIEPRLTTIEREQMQNILELIASDRMDKATALIEKHRGEAASAVFDFTLGNIYFQQEQLDQATAAYEIAVQKYPKFRRAWRNLGLSYVRESQFDKALTALTRVVELGGDDAITYGLIGFAYASVDNPTSAESAYRTAILLDPQTMDWKMGLARSLFKQERFAEAVALCDTLIAKHPDRADLWLLQANAYLGLKQPLSAAENYEFIDRLGKSTADTLSMLGDIYINEEIFDLAVNAYLRAMDQSPPSPPDRAIRAAKVLTARGALSQTQQLIERIEAVYGDQLDTSKRKDLLKLRARLAVANGASDEEVRVLEQIVALDPLDGEALILLGQHSSRAGEIEKAIFYYERAASLEAFEADAKVRHAQLLVKTGHYEAALPLLRRAQQLKPRDNIQDYLEQVERVAKGR
jgi:tetratricopeptide (TPR) repeat protein